MKLADGGGGGIEYPFFPSPTATATPILEPTITSIIYPFPKSTPINGKGNLFPLFFLILIVSILIVGYFSTKFVKKKGKLI